MASRQDESNFSLTEQVLIVILPAFTGTLSIMGSSCIIWMLLQRNFKLLKLSVKYRFLFALSIADIINSSWFLYWSGPIPEGTPGVWGAMGNQTTCNVQGWFLQFGLLGAFCNTALALYYHKGVVHNMKDREIASRYEIKSYVLAMLWSAGTATVALFQDLYAYSAVGCAIVPDPLRCHRRDDVECNRGENAYIYLWVYTGIPYLLLLIYIAYAMVAIYRKVKLVSSKAEKWSIHSTLAHHRKSSLCMESREESPRELVGNDQNKVEYPEQALGGTSGDCPVTQEGPEIEGEDEPSGYTSSVQRKDAKATKYKERVVEAATQCGLYVLAYVVTHQFAFVVHTVEMFGGTNPGWLMILENTFWPLQGFANVFVFLRPQINILRKENPDLSYLRAAWKALGNHAL
eukprot:scaffold9945_cov182-Amphora_coffeaeformis.AAC.1